MHYDLSIPAQLTAALGPDLLRRRVAVRIDARHL